MNITDTTESEHQLTVSREVQQLKTQVVALEQLLEVYEKETIEKSNRLEQALTELHQHTQRLTHAESALATLRSMLNSMGDAVVVVDKEGKFLFLNPSAEKFLGISTLYPSLQSWAKAWSVYLPDRKTIHPLEAFPLFQAMRGAHIDSTEIYACTPHVTCSSRCMTGAWFSVTARSLRNQEGEIQGGVAVFHNITSLKQVEIALRQSETHSREQAQQLQQALYNLQNVQAQLVQTEKMSSLGQLVAGIAHEINNPVNFVYGNLSPARNYSDDLINLLKLYQIHYPDPHPDIQVETEEIDLDFVMEDLPKLLSSMKVGADRIQGIVSSLRTFCRVDEADMRTMDIHDGLESTLMILRNRLKAKPDAPEIEITRNYGNLPLVECYAGQLNQVFMNILSNAIDALEEICAEQKTKGISPNITLQTDLTPDQRVTVCIKDNGPGIDETTLSKLFVPFFTTKPLGKGTGMGLSISHQIVTEKHNGCLTCHSKIGQGTAFMITIPLVHAGS
ncbi:MAG: ATP-binding protein [Leptolyngbyaceae cyanobacterium]